MAESSNAVVRKNAVAEGRRPAGHAREEEHRKQSPVIITIWSEDIKKTYIWVVSLVITIAFWWQKMGKPECPALPCCTEPRGPQLRLAGRRGD